MSALGPRKTLPSAAWAVMRDAVVSLVRTAAEYSNSSHVLGSRRGCAQGRLSSVIEYQACGPGGRVRRCELGAARAPRGTGIVGNDLAGLTLTARCAAVGP